MKKTPHGRRWVKLKTNPLTLLVNSVEIPIEELVYSENGEIAVDTFRVNDALNQKVKAAEKAYQPNTDKREIGKMKKQAMYKDWNDAYLDLKRKNKHQSKTWCAKQIARMDIAQGRKRGTIYKNMG